MSLYTPATEDGEILNKSEFGLIAAAIDALSTYGGIYLSGTVAFTFDTAHKELTVFDLNGALGQVTTDLADGSLIVPDTGDYVVWMSLALSGLDSNRTYNAEFRVNDQPTGGISGGAPARFQTAGAMRAYSVPYTLAAGDRVSIYVWADADGETVTIEKANFGVRRLG